MTSRVVAGRALFLSQVEEIASVDGREKLCGQNCRNPGSLHRQELSCVRSRLALM